MGAQNTKCIAEFKLHAIPSKVRKITEKIIKSQIWYSERMRFESFRSQSFLKFNISQSSSLVIFFLSFFN